MIRIENGVLKSPPDFILCADVHIVKKNPIARLDDYAEVTQWKKLMFLQQVQKKCGCPVLCAGDLLDKWNASSELLSKVMKHLPKNMYTVYGQHELPEHNLSLAYKSGIHTLEIAGFLKILTPDRNWDSNSQTLIVGASWGQDLGKYHNSKDERKIAVMHRFVWEEKEVFSKDNTRAINILKKYPMYDLILTGDNHKPFVVEYKGRLLVNSGSFFRMTAGQTEHRPRVYLYYAESNQVVPYYIPIKEGVVSREHIKDKQEKSDKLSAYISGWDTDFGDSINYERNLKKFLEENIIRKEVKEIINKVL